MTHLLTLPVARRVVGIGIALAVGLALPVLVHAIPASSGPPMGARLLPIFLAATLAAMRLDAVSALAIAIATPLLNRLVTGSPEGPMLATVLIELTLVVTIVLLVRRHARYLLPAVAAPAYLVAATVAGLVLHGDAPAATLAFAFTASWPGLLLLAGTGALAASSPRADAGGAS